MFFAALGGDEKAAVDEKAPNPWRRTLVNFLRFGDNEEVAPESYSHAVFDPEWRKSMMSEIKALRNSGCWRVGV